MANEEKPKKSRVQVIARYSGLGFQTVGIIGGGAWLGHLLDKKYELDKNWFTLAFVLVFIVISMAYTIRTLNKFNNE
jgi:hypothetical protein